jgi:hypothetical protein
VWSFVLRMAGAVQDTPTWLLPGGGCFSVRPKLYLGSPEEGLKVPVVAISTEPHHFELKTVHSGYVKVREMSYGERIYRSNLTGAMKLLKDTKSDYAGEIAMETSRLTEWDFANLIVEHNLDKAEGVPFNFKNAGDLKLLPARIGDEIGKYIDQVNSFEDIDEGN